MFIFVLSFLREWIKWLTVNCWNTVFMLEFKLHYRYALTQKNCQTSTILVLFLKYFLWFWLPFFRLCLLYRCLSPTPLTFSCWNQPTTLRSFWRSMSICASESWTSTAALSCMKPWTRRHGKNTNSSVKCHLNTFVSSQLPAVSD